MLKADDEVVRVLARTIDPKLLPADYLMESRSPLSRLEGEEETTEEETCQVRVTIGLFQTPLRAPSNSSLNGGESQPRPKSLSMPCLSVFHRRQRRGHLWWQSLGFNSLHQGSRREGRQWNHPVFPNTLEQVHAYCSQTGSLSRSRSGFQDPRAMAHATRLQFLSATRDSRSPVLAQLLSRIPTSHCQCRTQTLWETSTWPWSPRPVSQRRPYQSHKPSRKRVL